MQRRLQEVADDMEIVREIRSAIAEQIGRDRFERCFAAVSALTLRGHTLVITAPSAFYRDWLKRNFHQTLVDVCTRRFSAPATVVFEVATADERPPTAAIADEHPHGPGAGTVSALVPPIAPHTTVARRTRPLSRFDQFVVGESNRLAYTAAAMVAQDPGRVSPLLLHGPTGTGKTHLLEGVVAAVRDSEPRRRALLLTADQYTSHFTGAVRGGGMPIFRSKYHGLAMLVVDDVQFLVGKTATLREFSHTIDTLLESGAQVVLAGDRPPADLAELGPELLSRLQGGLVCAVEPPDHATRLGMVDRMAPAAGVDLPAAVRRYLATHLVGDARRLSGAVHRLRATQQALGRPVTLRLAEEALADVIHAGDRMIALEDIGRAVCESFGLEPRTIRSADRSRHAQHARMLAMWLARKHTRAALSEIGYYFGKRRHSTVVAAQKRVDALMAARRTLRLADESLPVEAAVRRVERRLCIG